MALNDEGRRPENQEEQNAAGWTTLHSWIFLGIVALGLVVIAIQNRYHYLSPLGLGKAYRIDKFLGGIQEFDPGQGWIKAQLEAPPQPISMLPPSGVPGAPTVPGSAPSPGNQVRSSVPVAHPQEGSVGGSAPQEKKERSSAPAPQPQVTTQPQALPKTQELSPAEKFASFKKEFPDFGKDEYQLANDDLYPDWKANVNPKGTWKEFLPVYRDFIQWWTDAGSPPEPGFKLWKKFLKSRR
jgi:hypothetical protein